ncbi:MAG: phage tail protein, partial [Pseudomonadota bacterium]
MTTFITDIGRQKMAAAAANNTQLHLAEMALAADDVQPTGSETALPGELYRAVIGERGTVDGSAHVAYFKMTVPEDGGDGKNYGPWTAWLWGLFDTDGDLIVIGRFGNVMVKTDPDGPELRALKLTVKVVFDNMDTVNLTFTPATDFVPGARRIDTGFGLKGGGDLSQDRTHEVDTDDLDGRYIPQIVDGRAQGDVVDPGLPDENFFNLHPVPKTGSIGQYVQMTGALEIEFAPLSGAGPLMLAFQLQTASLERGINVYFISGQFQNNGSLASFRVHCSNPANAGFVRVYFDDQTDVFRIYVGELADVHNRASAACTMQAMVSHRTDAQTKINLGSLKPRYENTAFVGVEKASVPVGDMDARRVVGRSIATRENFDLSSSAYQPIVLTGSVNDEEGAYSLVSGRFQPQRPGYYRVHGQMQITNGPSGMFAMRLELNNGSQFICGDSGFAHPTEFMPASASGTVYLNGSSDYVRLLLKRDEVDANSQRRINYAEFEAV